MAILEVLRRPNFFYFGGKVAIFGEKVADFERKILATLAGPCKETPDYY